jgi:hypothetical protein
MHACTPALLEHFNWELFDHPPYSPEQLLPEEMSGITYLQQYSDDGRFQNNAECIDGRPL